MPESDLVAEGGRAGTPAAFYDLMGLPPSAEVAVVRFEMASRGVGLNGGEGALLLKVDGRGRDGMVVSGRKNSSIPRDSQTADHVKI
jgi:hypothetical protein